MPERLNTSRREHSGYRGAAEIDFSNFSASLTRPLVTIERLDGLTNQLVAGRPRGLVDTTPYTSTGTAE